MVLRTLSGAVLSAESIEEISLNLLYLKIALLPPVTLAQQLSDSAALLVYSSCPPLLRPKGQCASAKPLVCTVGPLGIFLFSFQKAWSELRTVANLGLQSQR